MKRIFVKFLILVLLVLPLKVEGTTAVFSSQDTVSGNSVSTGCWVPPIVPVLISPENNATAGVGSAWMLNPVMDWSDSTSSCPLPTTITYQYESYHDAGMTSLAYRSGWLAQSQIPAPGTPDGTYYWRVKARDNFGNESAFSSSWKFTVDRTPPAPDLVLSNLLAGPLPKDSGKPDTTGPLPSVLEPPIVVPKLVLSQDDKNVTFMVNNLSGYKNLSYELTYDTETSPQGVKGRVDLAAGQKDYQKEILLGTCSTGGTCVYHTGVKNVHLKVTLLDSSGTEFTLEKTL